MEDSVSIHKCLNCNSEISLLFATDDNGESVNVEPCPICEADCDEIILLNEKK